MIGFDRRTIVHVVNEPWSRRAKIYIRRPSLRAGYSEYLHQGDRWEEFQDGMEVPCWCVMPFEIATELANVLCGNGFKPEDESVARGKLDAQGKHLEDMREITRHLLKMKEHTQ